MYLLILNQGNFEIKMGLFETLEEGRDFVKKLPGYRLASDEDGYSYESLILDDIPDYIEVEHNGNVVPISRLSFVEEEDVDIFWYELPVISAQGNGMVDGITRVDAYNVENNEVRGYIKKREDKYLKIKNYLTEKGYDVDRNFFGSEDGEAIVYKKKNEDNWHFLIHMDACFVENDDDLTALCDNEIDRF